MARRTTSAVTVTAASRQVQNPMRLKGTRSDVLLPVSVSPTVSGSSAFTATARRNPAVHTIDVRSGFQNRAAHGGFPAQPNGRNVHETRYFASYPFSFLPSLAPSQTHQPRHRSFPEPSTERSHKACSIFQPTHLGSGGRRAALIWRAPLSPFPIPTTLPF